MVKKEVDQENKMKQKISQKDRILNELRKNGVVSRNSAIRGEYGEFITRLGAIMCDLKAEGINFETKQLRNPNDFEYRLLDKPKEIKRYFVNGVEVAPPKYIW